MRTLKNVMLINAISSGATGLGLVVFSDFVAGLFETKATVPFIEVGLFLLIFATLVFSVSRKSPLHPGAVRLVIVLDVMWVVVSFAIILLRPFTISVLGYVAIGAVAAWVSAMAYFQSAGLKQLSTVK